MNEVSPESQPSEQLGPSEVRHLAHLARLKLSDDEVPEISRQLRLILAAVERIREIAADDVPPKTHAVDLINVTRPDVEWECLPRDAVLAAAPSVEEYRFRVPPVFGP